MPLLVICGGPSSGKTTIAERIGKYFEEQGFDSVEIISDQCNGNFSRSIYNDSRKEREQRGFLRSEVQRRLAKDRLIICDSLNYIKGFRYELFCVAKLVQTTLAIVFCETDAVTAKWLDSQKDDESQRYEGNKIDDILMRFEKPDGKNRWDSPLFTISIGNIDLHQQQQPEQLCASEAVQPESDGSKANNSPRHVRIPFDEIFASLVKGKSLSANLSTQSAPLKGSNFLHDLDRVTQQIVSSVFQQQKTVAPDEETFTMTCCNDTQKQIMVNRRRTLPELTRLRRQFINYAKMHPVDDKCRIVSMFVNYLNSNI